MLKKVRFKITVSTLKVNVVKSQKSVGQFVFNPADKPTNQHGSLTHLLLVY